MTTVIITGYSTHGRQTCKPTAVKTAKETGGTLFVRQASVVVGKTGATRRIGYLWTLTNGTNRR